MTIAESVHQFLELSGPLNLEKNLIVAVGNFDVEVLAMRFLWLWILGVGGGGGGGQ